MKIIVKKSKIHENGLFATEDINKGEFICLLPIDYINYENKWYSTENTGKKINLRYAVKCFLKKKQIIGVSDNLKKENEFVGHIINDYVDMSLFDKNKYEILSSIHENVEVSENAEFYKNRLGLKIKAKRNIKKDEEMFFSYGKDYWKQYSNEKIFEIIPEIKYVENFEHIDF